jgi:hypothetical protein
MKTVRDTTGEPISLGIPDAAFQVSRPERVLIEERIMNGCMGKRDHSDTFIIWQPWEVASPDYARAKARVRAN